MKHAILPNARLSDKAMLALSITVLEALTNNPFFVSPAPSLVTLQAAQNIYITSLAKAASGSSQEKAQKKADKKALLKLLRQLVAYVNQIANGNLTMLHSCGFSISKDRKPIILGTPVAKVVHGNQAGELILSTAALKGAMCYQYQYATDPSAEHWHRITTTRARCKITNLVPGQVYSLRIVAIGTNGQVTISEVITKMAV